MSEEKDFESRLRDALRADGDRAEVSAGAFTKVRGRLEAPRANRTARRVFVGFGVMAAAAACTAAILVVPRIVGPTSVNGASAPDTNNAKAEATTSSPESTETTRSSKSTVPVLGELRVGEEVNLALIYEELPGDNASIMLWTSTWNAAENKWNPLRNGVQVGERRQWKFTLDSAPQLCEFRVTPQVSEPATVRVRLAQGGGCSEPFVYELSGTTLKLKAS